MEERALTLSARINSGGVTEECLGRAGGGAHLNKAVADRAKGGKSEMQLQVLNGVHLSIPVKQMCVLKLEISLSFDKKYFGIIQRFQRQRSMIYYLQVDDDLLTFSYFHFLYI